ncbi:MAG: STAS domain-containing protein [Deltaproteobacteria bacterium]|nr:STAS domain-containing protein [Deltaproteobacteria bacterium]
MKASIEKKGCVMVIAVDGTLSFENNPEFEKKILEITKDKRKKYRLVFDLKNLNFVGSTGIKDFVLILKEFNKLSPRPRICGLKKEFIWMFNAFQGKKKFYVFKDEEEAAKSFEV